MQESETIEFKPFRLDYRDQSLWRQGERLSLTPKAFAVLRHLVDHAGQLVTRDSFFEIIWPEVYVSDEALMVCIRELRQVLGDQARSPQYIETVHGRGYRFVAAVRVSESPGPDSRVAPSHLAPPNAQRTPMVDRRQLTVWFCDLVDSTLLAGQLDPEDWGEVLQAYHHTCAEVVERFDGYVAQYLGDGVLVYFGYPVAHEDDAQRAVWSALELLEALGALNARLTLPSGYQLAVRLGLHTGLVVVGYVGAGKHREPIAQGETPHIAARLQSLAGPNELLISATTRHLLGGMFHVKELGPRTLKGVTTPIQLYRVQGSQAVESRFEAMTVTDLTPLVGREEELELLWRRWQQASEGEGQVVLLSGEAGLGKSRLTQALLERLGDEPHQRLLYQCSPYHTNSAFYPIISHLERTLQLEQAPLAAAKLDRLETLLAHKGIPVAEVAPLFASLLSIPNDDRYGQLFLSPKRQKEQTIAAWAELVVGLSQREPILIIFEDVHWSDPTSLEAIAHLIDRVQETHVLLIITCRPEFVPPWGPFMPITTHVLNRLTRRQAIEMVEWIMGHQVLPAEMVEQIVTKTDGIPLFVEELSKSVQESEWLKEQGEHDTLFASQLPPVLPVSLRDALMARLDRLLPMVKETAQLGATLGREFAYELLAAVSPWCDHALREALDDLVTAGLLFRRGTPPEATYFFKHALVQEAAYQSLLKSTRQQYHEQIAHILEETFVDFATSHPEMVAHHYSEAGMAELATPYWQRAGAQNSSRSAYPEAISYLNKGLSVLQTLPASPERARREMELYTTLAPALRVAKGPASLETERAYIQARKLCHQVGAVSPLLTMLEGLCSCYVVRGEYRNALELGEESLALAQRTQTPARLLDAYRSLGTILRFMGEFASARTYLEAGIALYDPQQHPELVRLHGMDLGVICGAVKAFIIWLLGYADQARQCLDEVLVLARQHAHPYSLAFVLNQAIDLFQLWEDLEQAQRHLELIQHIATTQGFPFWTMRSNLQQGVGAVLQGHEEKGISQLREGLAAQEKQRVGMGRTQWLVALAKAHGQAGQPKVGLEVLNDALTIAHTKAERYLEAEVHRLRGELLLQSSQAPERAAADCFQRALTLAQEQGAKVWELRAAISLSRLWQQQGHREDARELLGGVYHGFSEGFDTVDLQRAQALLARLA